MWDYWEWDTQHDMDPNRIKVLLQNFGYILQMWEIHLIKWNFCYKCYMNTVNITFYSDAESLIKEASIAVFTLV